MLRTTKLLATLLLAGCHSGSGDSLVRVATFVTGVHPNDAAIGDFDGDGDTDVAVPGLLSPQVATLWSGGGELAYSLEAPIGVGASGAAAIDLDGDGVDELVLSNREWTSVLVLSAASGRWQLARALDIAGAEHVRGGDFDGDGNLDLAITRFNADELLLALGDGSGDFVEHRTVPLAPRPQSLVVVARAGAPPLIAISEARGDSVAIAGQTNAGTFEVLTRVATPEWPACLTAMDIDDDGELELVGAANLGDAIFTIDELEHEPTLATAPAGAGAFGIASLDGARIAVSNKSDDTLMLFEATPAGLRLTDEIATEAGPSPVYTVDLLGDARQELVVIDAFADSVSVYTPTSP